MRSIVFILGTIFCTISLTAQNNLKFVEEYIDFKLSPHYFSINGVYVFCHSQNSGLKTFIEFPFAASADSIIVERVYNLNTNRNIEYTKRGKSIFFWLNTASSDTLSVNIAYKQATQTENVYILTSTQAWGVPLEKVKYSFRAEGDVSVGEFSYPPDSVSADRGLCLWEKFNFMPNKNFIVTISDGK